MGMRIARGVVVAAALLLTGCVTLSSQTGTYEDILAVGATYPAGKLPITRINRLFGRDAGAPMDVVVGHRETRTEMGEITPESIRIAYPEDHRCSWDFDDAPERFNEFMECLARSLDAIFGVIVGEVVSDDITLHTILGFHIKPPPMRSGAMLPPWRLPERIPPGNCRPSSAIGKRCHVRTGPSIPTGASLRRADL